MALTPEQAVRLITKANEILQAGVSVGPNGSKVPVPLDARNLMKKEILRWQAIANGKNPTD